MKLIQIQEKLELARKRQRKLRIEIDRYRELLRDAGHDPDKPKVDLVPRNKKIYKYWKRGKTFTQISIDTNLSTTRISNICHRIDNMVQNHTILPAQYKDLAGYKTEG